MPGSTDDLDRIWATCVEQLRALAGHFMRSECQGHTWSPTALMHEAWIRMAAQQRTAWRTRSQVLAVAAEMMRRALKDHAKRYRTAKRNGHRSRISLPPDLVLPSRVRRAVEVLPALETLEEADPKAAKVVELKFFGGMTYEEIACELGVRQNEVRRWWELARDFLDGYLKSDETDT